VDLDGKNESEPRMGTGNVGLANDVETPALRPSIDKIPCKVSGAILKFVVGSNVACLFRDTIKPTTLLLFVYWCARGWRSMGRACMAACLNVGARVSKACQHTLLRRPDFNLQGRLGCKR
jgi:hypothetical protein